MILHGSGKTVVSEAGVFPDRVILCEAHVISPARDMLSDDPTDVINLGPRR